MIIAVGLLALSVLVFIHETGHYIAARLCGVTVESFSVGMGPVLLHRTVKGTDYRLSLVPFGGYCGMKGEKDFQNAVDSKLRSFPKDPTAFYGTSPFKRLCIALAGPACNALFAAFAYTLIGLAGYTYYSADNRVILSDDITGGGPSPARLQGIRTGDRIVSINGKETPTFSDISLMISSHPDEDISAEVLRDGAALHLTLHPALDKASASGKIGVYNWIDPVLAEIAPGSPAEQAGLQAGDIIAALDGERVFAAAQIPALTAGKGRVQVRCARPGAGPGGGEYVFEASVDIPPDGDAPLFLFAAPEYHYAGRNIVSALGYGFAETARTTALTAKGIAVLFKGVDVTNALSGPARITYLIGDTVKSGFGVSVNAGVVSMLNLLALISISLFMMNLLPVPVFDGGTVFFSLGEMLFRRPLPPKFLYRIQIAGLAVIALLFGLSMFSDAKFFWRLFKQ